jgi:hypothetical protein
MPRGEDKGFTIKRTKALRETERALLVQSDFFDDGQRWIPKSQIHDDSEVFEVDHEGKLVVNAWLAEKEGWEEEDD